MHEKMAGLRATKKQGRVGPAGFIWWELPE
jgi:hypothetical protein